MMQQNRLFIRMLGGIFLLVYGVVAYAQQEGIASYYGNQMHGRKTASGEKYDKDAFTCAHRTYPFGTLLRVTRLDNGATTVVRVNDRGPYGRGRVVDVSGAAARELDLIKAGVARVRVELSDSVAGSAPWVATDSAAATLAPQVVPPAPIAQNLFEISAMRIPAEGYAIQIQSVNSADALLAKLADLRSKTTAQTIVHVSKQGSTTLYRLLVGTFFTQEAANQMRDALAQEGYDGLVISLQNLR